MARPTPSASSHRHGGRPAYDAGRTLDALNIFLADVRDVLGSYLALYLPAVRGPAHGWNEATVGPALAIGVRVLIG